MFPRDGFFMSIMAGTEKERLVLWAKARKKYLSTSLASELVKLNSPLNKQYALTYGCQSQLYMETAEEGGKLRSNYYCKNRWCQSCQSIKMATIINNYRSEILALNNDDLYFVTLTDKACKYAELPNQIQIFQMRWRKITDMARKYRTDFVGIRKFECKTAKNHQNMMHFHYHMIIKGKDNAEWAVLQWLRLSDTASTKAQNVRKIDNVDAAIIEVFKYAAKLCTAQKKGSKEEAEKPMEPWQLDVIFQAIKGKRIYQPFGGLKQHNEDDMDTESQEVIQAAKGWYTWAGNDWYHNVYGHGLTGWKPNSEDIEIFKPKNPLLCGSVRGQRGRAPTEQKLDKLEQLRTTHITL